MNKKKLLISCALLLFTSPILWAQTQKTDIAAMERSIDSVATQGTEKGAYPGCQIVIVQNGHTVLSKCYGYHSAMTRRKVQPTDLYDLASVTKTTATLPAIMRLYEQGKVKLTDKVSTFLPFLRHTDKENITIEDLLFHESGLPSTISFYYKAIDPKSVTGELLQETPDKDHVAQIDKNCFISQFKYRKNAIAANKDKTHTLHVYDNMWLDKSYMDTLKCDIVKYKYQPHHYQYSDIGFILLQWVVESITKCSLSDYVEKEFYLPMRATRTLFLPSRRYEKKEIVPTVTQDALRNAKEICGYTQDEVAAYMGGVAGEAGLYSTASDLAKIYQMYLNKGTLNGKRYLKESTCTLFETRQSKISHRGLGFDRPKTKKSAQGSTGQIIPASSFGHGGFTGTNVWVDPENKLIYVFLCNRVSPFPWNTRLMDLGIFPQLQKAIYSHIPKAH